MQLGRVRYLVNVLHFLRTEVVVVVVVEKLVVVAVVTADVVLSTVLKTVLTTVFGSASPRRAVTHPLYAAQSVSAYAIGMRHALVIIDVPQVTEGVLRSVVTADGVSSVWSAALATSILVSEPPATGLWSILPVTRHASTWINLVLAVVTVHLADNALSQQSRRHNGKKDCAHLNVFEGYVDVSRALDAARMGTIDRLAELQHRPLASPDWLSRVGSSDRFAPLCIAEWLHIDHTQNITL